MGCLLLNFKTTVWNMSRYMSACGRMVCSGGQEILEGFSECGKTNVKVQLQIKIFKNSIDIIQCMKGFLSRRSQVLPSFRHHCSIIGKPKNISMQHRSYLSLPAFLIPRSMALTALRLQEFQNYGCPQIQNHRHVLLSWTTFNKYMFMMLSMNQTISTLS